ncbi:hypothetical protein EAG_05210 [Camponotus floridanus]|uniref:Uncharacterized protein n=1 Tax=Camponotus floridanus TaxID=104421 RepID=E1ZXY4_CAMFO|nr:hypothetical protein EAG_05210 [Camponotus floridanus]
MSSSSDREYHTVTRDGIFASTPIDDVPARNYTISLSQIGTASSLSGDRIEDGLQSQRANRLNNAKTYKSPKEKQSQNLLGIYWNATYSPPCFSMSDLLWQEFVNKNHKEMPEYLASCSAQVIYKQSDFLHKHPDIPPKFESPPHLPGSVCIRGYSTRETKKWITNVTYYPKEETKVRQTKTRKRNKKKQKKRTVTLKSMNTLNETTTVYDVDDEMDVEFETGGRDGKRMSFSEFCQKRKLDNVRDSF